MSNHEIIGTSQSYTPTSDRDNGIEPVKFPLEEVKAIKDQRTLLADFVIPGLK